MLKGIINHRFKSLIKLTETVCSSNSYSHAKEFFSKDFFKNAPVQNLSIKT